MSTKNKSEITIEKDKTVEDLLKIQREDMEKMYARPMVEGGRHIYKALFEIQKVIHNAIKDSENKYHNSSYASLNAVLEAVKGPANDHGILINHRSGKDVFGQYEQTKLIHVESGEYVESRVYFEIENKNMQGVKGAITYARRADLEQMFCIASDDDDGNSTVNPREMADTQETQSGGDDFYSYVIPFGKYKGKSFMDISLSDAENYGAFLIRSAGDKGLNKQAKTFISMVSSRMGIEKNTYNNENDVRM